MPRIIEDVDREDRDDEDDWDGDVDLDVPHCAMAEIGHPWQLRHTQT